MQQAGAVAGAQPDRQHPYGGGRGEAGADAYRDGLDAVQVPVEGRQVLSEALRQAVVGVGAARGVHGYGGGAVLGARGEADRMVGGGEDDPPDPGLPGRLVEVVGALDVGAQDLLERGLQGDPREMHDRVDPGEGRAQRLLVAQVGGDGIRCAVDRPPVEEVYKRQHQGAEAAGGAGEQNGAGCGHGRGSFEAGRPYGWTAFTCVGTLGRHAHPVKTLDRRGESACRQPCEVRSDRGAPRTRQGGPMTAPPSSQAASTDRCSSP